MALANSVDPDETLHDAASHQGLRCLLIGISEVYEEEDNALFMSKDPTDKPILAGYLINSPGNRILKAFANSLDPDETPQNVASHQDPNYELKSFINTSKVSILQNAETSSVDELWNQFKALIQE
ncbi:hypothetical protein DPMN_003703, partial [Dreissena polymorpha]